MKAYRFRNERLYRRRRFSLFILLLFILGISLFFFLNYKNKENNQAGTTPTPTGIASPTASPDVTPVNDPVVTEEPSPTPTPTPSPITEAGTQTVDHGFLPAIGSLPPSGKMKELEKLVQDFIAKQSGKYGVTFIDLATGESFGVQDTDEYIAASTSKFPMNVLLYQKIESGEVDPESMLEYKKEDLEYGTGIIQNSAYGTQYSVRETSRLSIVKSDNCGINMIIRLLDIENIRQYLVDLGGVVYYGKRHRSCPHDMALVGKDLYRLYLGNPDVYGQLIYDLEHTDFNDKINALLPKDVKVAHKIGINTRVENDVGIVFASHPYVLSVMTDNVDAGTAKKRIAEMSKMIYDFVEAYAQIPE